MYKIFHAKDGPVISTSSALKVVYHPYSFCQRKCFLRRFKVLPPRLQILLERETPSVPTCGLWQHPANVGMNTRQTSSRVYRADRCFGNAQGGSEEGDRVAIVSTGAMMGWRWWRTAEGKHRACMITRKISWQSFQSQRPGTYDLHSKLTPIEFERKSAHRCRRTTYPSSVIRSDRSSHASQARDLFFVQIKLCTIYSHRYYNYYIGNRTISEPKVRIYQAQRTNDKRRDPIKRPLYDSALRNNPPYLIQPPVPFLPLVAYKNGNFAIYRFNVALAIANL